MLILFILSVAVFYLLRVVPGDPAIRMCGLNCTTEQINAIHHEMGLDKSYPQQYWDWISGVLTGDLGTLEREPQAGRSAGSGTGCP